MLKDMVAQAVFTTAVDRLTKAAKKNGLDRDEFQAVTDAIRKKHYPVSAQMGIKLNPEPPAPEKGAKP